MAKTKRLRKQLIRMGIQTTLFNCVHYKKDWLTPKGAPNCTFGNVAQHGMFSWSAHTTPVEIAISMSHKLAVRDFARRRSRTHDFALILEEDVLLKPHFAHNFAALLQRVLDAASTRDFGLLYLWNTNAQGTRSKLRPLIKDVAHRGGAKPVIPVMQETAPHNAGGVAYLMSEKLAKREAARTYPIRETADLHLGHETWGAVHRSMPFLSVLMVQKAGKRCAGARKAIQANRWTDHACIESPLVTTAWYEGTTSDQGLPDDFTMRDYLHRRELQRKARTCARTAKFKRYQ
jgi:GR25 family glycosyltransferase involved in LPS biosynthesis